MHETLAVVNEYLRGAWRFRWLAITLAWVIAVGGWLLVYSLPDIYEARAKIYVDTESVLKPLLQGLAVNTDITSEVNMMSAVVTSRTNLERVARKTDLSLRARTPQEFENLVSALPTRIGLVGGGRDGMYTVTYKDHERAMALRVVDTLVTTFVEDTLGIKRAESHGAQRFIEEQIRGIEKRLKEAEDRLAAFKRQHVGSMPGETGDYYARMQTAMQNVEKLQADLRLATEKRNTLKEQLAGEQPTFGLFNESPGSQSNFGPYDKQIAELQKKLDALLLQYTEKHPDVIALRETIADLEAKKRSAAPPPAAPGVEGMDPTRMMMRNLDINPVYQTLKNSLNQAELEIVELRSKLSEQQRIVNELKSRVDTIPEVEAQLAQLNRDYEVNQQQYTALKQRLESARLSDEAESNTKFKIIDKPSVPLTAGEPNRPLLLTMVLLVALGAGLGATVLLDQVRPVISTSSALSRITGRPVLGSVRRVATAEVVARARRQNLLLAGATALLLIAYVGSLSLRHVLPATTKAFFG
jgi:polysaccharide chain length determinant protein (PEP-CTERM system associated)